MNQSIINVSKKLNITVNQVETVLKLLQEGATIPFIARYRQGQTNGLNEEQISAIAELYEYDLELTKRKEYVLNILTEKQLLTNELKQKIWNAETKQEVENIYEPFKIGKKTKASEAIELGLDPLAKKIETETSDKFNVFKEAEKYLSDKLPTVDEVLLQTKYIIAQDISQDIATREYIKNELMKFGVIKTQLKKNAEDEKEVFKQYYDYSEKVKTIPNHRILAITRGEDKKILSYDIEFNEKKILYDLNQKYFINKRTAFIMREALEDAIKRLLIPSIIREIKTDLFLRAEKDAINIFALNLENMLLAPAIKNKKIMAIDPAYVNGCKIAILDENGKFLTKDLIFPNAPKKDWKQSSIIVNKLLNEYKIDIVVIGNGTASRETEEFIKSLINWRKNNNYPDENIQCAIVSEVGASVYSASKIAQEEFPNFSVEERSAVNIGRRFQDPLNELIKIDPKSIGIGQYQHDVNQKELNNQLRFKTEKIVNLVGVDLNTATKVILSYISGLSNTIAENIVKYREENGKFTDRKQLKEVKGLGPKAFEQSVGFLRIYDSNIFYDRTNIHPESYKLADLLVKKLNIDLKDENDIKAKLNNIDIKELANQLSSNEYDINLIVDALLAPGKDIRDKKEGFIVSDKILTIDDIHAGLEIKGQIQNITNFGAFAFIGIKQNVLIHITNMKRHENDFIKHPTDVIKIGQNVNILITEVEKERDRIQGKILWNKD
ncbi:RNA (S1 domain)-binding protein [Metamycoplasma cloacale]|uniref:S1 RNA-binding domain-containing protein n=1 Tax=Metamycoplasma cloacale TaxID=92401 RepID=A0A2Z4LMA4_9BACT|nr:Tex-like N-terminal domain-containing protein [Metamycoplasma cloacale]AWX42903.1 S1 RNA-binding domain-containing protein [Metamycoplasma cloacale]VEU79273.1 RNA (S1 domain)-binding protein [Metamycoplasma cloacale]